MWELIWKVEAEWKKKAEWKVKRDNVRRNSRVRREKKQSWAWDWEKKKCERRDDLSFVWKWNWEKRERGWEVMWKRQSWRKRKEANWLVYLGFFLVLLAGPGWFFLLKPDYCFMLHPYNCAYIPPFVYFVYSCMGRFCFFVNEAQLFFYCSTIMFTAQHPPPFFLVLFLLFHFGPKLHKPNEFFCYTPLSSSSAPLF